MRRRNSKTSCSSKKRMQDEKRAATREVERRGPSRISCALSCSWREASFGCLSRSAEWPRRDWEVHHSGRYDASLVMPSRNRYRGSERAADHTCAVGPASPHMAGETLFFGKFRERGAGFAGGASPCNRSIGLFEKTFQEILRIFENWRECQVALGGAGEAGSPA
jgi:hypothetical protein